MQREDQSKLNKLIQELCPKGVEYRTLGEVFNVKNGYTPSKKVSEFWTGKTVVPWFRLEDIRLNGRILDHAIQNVTMEAVKGRLFPRDSIIISTTATIGEYALIRVPFLANQQFTCLSVKKEYENMVNMKFVFYYCCRLHDYCWKILKQSSLPAVIPSRFVEFPIPVPPLPVQSEIVRILDAFTALTAELTAELTARRKQYEYYRDRLLNFDDLTGGVRWVKVKDAFKRLKGTAITAGKMKTIANDDGDIRIFAGGKTMINAFEDDIPCANITREPAVLVQSRGIIDFIYYDKPFTFKNEMWAYASDNRETTKYLYYLLKNRVNYFREMAASMGSLPQISLPITEEYEIPLPPLSEQRRIVSILDRFDALCNDLTQGLPAEIAARRKQYEFYRDRLLDFQRKV